MRFNPDLAEIRFGTGLGPASSPPDSARAILDRLTARDQAARDFPIAGFEAQAPDIRKERALAKRVRQGSDDARDQRRKLRKRMQERQMDWFKATLARYATSPDGMRERLTRFWANHFTVVGKRPMTRPLPSTFVEDAIRPHLAGRFSDMLRAAVTHPMMLDYLDQFTSFGEGSVAGRRQGKGLNENLAREVLELHTLGVDGPYTQTDVREFANLLAGFTFDRQGKVTFFPGRGSPGAETVLGKSYGGRKPRLADVHAALDDLAIHPATARHIARKLAMHFVSDTPDPGLVSDIETAFLMSGGDLLATYTALLNHPAAWDPNLQKAKQPFDFVASSLRAFGVTGDQIIGFKGKDVLNGIVQPMALMGQKWERPDGPDGWPDDAAHWITPQGLAARIQWALTIPTEMGKVLGASLPDPREFVDTALGSLANDQVSFVAAAAETRWEGVGLILSAPSFQRR